MSSNRNDELVKARSAVKSFLFHFSFRPTILRFAKCLPSVRATVLILFAAVKISSGLSRLFECAACKIFGEFKTRMRCNARAQLSKQRHLSVLEPMEVFLDSRRVSFYGLYNTVQIRTAHRRVERQPHKGCSYFLSH